MIVVSIGKKFIPLCKKLRHSDVLTDYMGSIYQINGRNLLVKEYIAAPVGIDLRLDSKAIELIVDGQCFDSPDSLVFLNEDLSFFEWMGDYIHFYPKLVHEILWNTGIGERYFSVNTHRIRDKDNRILLIDIEMKTIEVFKPPVLRPSCFLNENYFAFGDKGIFKISKSLQKDWIFPSVKGTVLPKLTYNCKTSLIPIGSEWVVANFSAKFVQRSKTVRFQSEDGSYQEQESPDFYLTDGRLVCLSVETGDLVWEANFDFQIDDFIEYSEGKLLITSERFLYIVDAETGAIEKKWDAGLRNKEERVLTGSNQLLMVGGYIFHFSHKDCRFQILDANTLEVTKTVDGVEKGLQFGADRPHVFEDKILVPVDLRDDPFIGGAILLIDLNNLDAELEIEQGPDFQFIEPSAEKPGPIECSVEYKDWGTMFRFAERVLMSKVMHHSADVHKENFEPRKVKLTYSGYEGDKELVQEKMEVFKKRFEYMVKEPQLAAITVPPVEIELNLL